MREMDPGGDLEAKSLRQASVALTLSPTPHALAVYVCACAYRYPLDQRQRLSAAESGIPPEIDAASHGHQAPNTTRVRLCASWSPSPSPLRH